jgi:hypothetical protein
VDPYLEEKGNLNGSAAKPERWAARNKEEIP